MVAAIAAGVGAVGSIAGGLISSSAAKSAANTQSQAADQASANSLAEFEQTSQNLQPFSQAGQSIAGQESNLFGASYTNPLVPGSIPQLNSSSAAVQQLASGIAPTIQSALQSGQTSGTLPGGYSFNVSNGQLQLIGQSGTSIGSFSADPSSAGAIANALSVNFGNNAINQNPQQYGAAPGPPSILGLNDPTYGLPSLGNTDFLSSMGVSNVGQLAFNPTQDTLNNLPGYQFELNQGLQATQNNATAQGLGVSGAAMKSAAGYAQGLASSDLSNYYNMWSGNLNNLSNVFSTNLMNQYNVKQGAVNNAYNRMLGVSNQGENAAATTGSQGVAAVGNSNAALVGGANAQAAGTVGSANALSSGISGVGSSATNALLLGNLMSGGGGQGYVDSGTF